MLYAYPAVLCPESDGRFSIWFPDLHGCASSGESIAEAIENARDALGLWLDGTQRHNNLVPGASAISDVSLEDGQTATWVDIDLSAYRKQISERYVRKTISIPAWMDAMAESAGLSPSQVFQEALCARLGITDH